MNKCFLLRSNLEKIGADSSCRFREKRKNTHFNSNNDVTELKDKLL